MRVDFMATARQYEEHLRPIWDALPPEERGTFITKPVKRHKRYDRISDGDICLVSSFGDYKDFCGARIVTTMSGHKVHVDRPPVPVALLEHGAGFTYQVNPLKPRWGGSYAGGMFRDYVSLFPSTNRWVAEANQRTMPQVPAPIVGCPKLDPLVRMPQPDNPQPVVAFSFHWDCNAHPETRTALPHYLDALPDIAWEFKRLGYTVLGHGHPRMQGELRFTWRRLGWEVVTDFADVARRADLYVCDTSSTIFEFAALGRPVVLLNAPWYRRDVHHGLRFWDHADVGLQVDEPEGLVEAVQHSLTHRGSPSRERAVAEVYPYLGHSAPRVVDVIREFMATH